ncbi:MAG: diguanylate cyclase [Phycisphaerales bacterium]
MTITAPQFDESQPTVLVIDDSPDVHRLLKARLRHEELDLRAATSGRAGIEAARDQRPAIVLLDLDMPDMDGFEVLRNLKNDPTTVHIPVIVLSGLQSAQDKVTAFDLGAVDYITKPFNLTELRVRVRSALRMHRLVQMLAQRAQIDGLTGLWNRAHFDRRLADEVAGCQRHDRALSLAMIDVDDFKSINDTYGHPAGDAVLQGMARVIQKECRQEDVACRYGGEEFALIMPDTTPAQGMVVCERVRSSLASVVWPRHPERSVTVSIGLAGAVRIRTAQPFDWVEAADKALYTAKKTGRNRSVMTDIDGGSRLAKAG